MLRGPRSVVRAPCSVVVFGGPGSNWTIETETETEAEAEIVMASWGDGMAQHRQSSICNQRDPKSRSTEGIAMRGVAAITDRRHGLRTLCMRI